PADFFMALCEKLSTHAISATEFNKSMNRWVLIEHPSHLYNVYPYLFKEYWDGENIQFTPKFLNETIFDRVKKCTLTMEKKEKILLQIVGKTTLENHFEHLVEDRNLDLTTFIQLAKKLIPDNLQAAFEKSVNNVMYEIPAIEVKAHLKSILSGIVSNSNMEQCCALILEKIKKISAENSSFTAYDLAHIIHTELIFVNVPIKVSKGEMEKHIRKWASLPEIIDIGNMNWTGSLTETSNYKYLSIMYDFTKGLTFCFRKNGYEESISEKTSRKILDKTVIYLPK
ncbi:MAG TPA: hypothetical protein VGP47_11170, partial [Parachlamydiaceae bacterium]|nr:hypothetical protein [Parachlamydiaceae bacterium]